MPIISRLFLKFGLLYFVAAMLCGILMAWFGAAALLPTYLHLFMVGWITQIIIGVALWLFPKWTKEQPRGREWMSWVALVTLNLGLLIRAVAEPLNTLGGAEYYQSPGVAAALISSGVLQWVGGMCFMLNIWGRIKPKRKRRPRARAKTKDRPKKDPPAQDRSTKSGEASS